MPYSITSNTINLQKFLGSLSCIRVGGYKAWGVGFDIYFANPTGSRVYFYLVGVCVMSASRILIFDVAANRLTSTIHRFFDTFTFGACVYLLTSCAHEGVLRCSCYSLETRKSTAWPMDGVDFLEFLSRNRVAGGRRKQIKQSISNEYELDSFRWRKYTRRVHKSLGNVLEQTN